MTIENLKEGPVTYSQSDAIVTLAEKWLHEYFTAFGPKRPGDLEDDFCGQPSIFEMMSDLQGRWRESPFYPALGRLIDKGLVRWRRAENGEVWYALTGPMPMLTEAFAMLAAPGIGAA
jgi:hypothetical protein